MNDPQSTYCENVEFRSEIFSKVLYRVEDWISVPLNIVLLELFGGWVAVSTSDTSGFTQGGEFLNIAFVLVSVYTATL